MPDYLDKLATEAKKTLDEGYYKVPTENISPLESLKKAIIESKQNAVITEIKAASPSRGIIKTNFDPVKIAKAMENGGAIGISVITEPKHFMGSLNNLMKIRKKVKIPILMKDIILSPLQIKAASKMGANNILFIKTLFEREYCEYTLDEMISEAHKQNLEVILETHTKNEFKSAIETDADIIGINNRNLTTLKVDIRTTEKILKKNNHNNKVIISESGVMAPSDLIFLRNCGAQAFLIGSSIMMADNIKRKVKEFVTAY